MPVIATTGAMLSIGHSSGQWRSGFRSHRIDATRRHPRRVAQRYRAVTLRERLRNERPTAGERANTGVSVFARLNPSGMSEFEAKRRVRGNRARILSALASK